MDRLISLNAVLSAIGEWIAHREYDYTNATEYLRNRIKAIPSAEPYEDANANQHNSNALNDVGQHTNALEGDAISRQDDRGVSLKSVKHALYDVCLHEDNMALFSKLLDRVNKARDWEEYQAIKQEPCTHPNKCHECEKILTCTYYKQEPLEVKHYGSGERTRVYECTPKREIELCLANIECLLNIALLDSDEHIREMGGEQELLNLMNDYLDLAYRFMGIVVKSPESEDKE